MKREEKRREGERRVGESSAEKSTVEQRRGEESIREEKYIFTLNQIASPIKIHCSYVRFCKLAR